MDYSKLLGSLCASSLVKMRGSADQLTDGLGVAYSFDVGLRSAGREHQRGVARVEVGDVPDLVGQQGTTRACVLRPPVHAWLEEGAVDDELAAPFEQVKL